MKSIKHVPSLIRECDDPVHTHSITSGESTINPAACSVVSAVPSQLFAVFSKYVQRILSGNFVLPQAQSQQYEGLEENTTCST